MPAKMFTRIACTFGSCSTMRNAFAIFSGLAPPPTSRKFAGRPPWCTIASIVPIARPAPFTMQPTDAVERDVVEPVAGGLDLLRVLLVEVAQLHHVALAEQRVVVEAHLRVEGDEVAVLGLDERVDLEHQAVQVAEEPVHALEQPRERGRLRLPQPDRGRDLAALEVQQTRRPGPRTPCGSRRGRTRRPPRCRRRPRRSRSRRSAASRGRPPATGRTRARSARRVRPARGCTRWPSGPVCARDERGARASGRRSRRSCAGELPSFTPPALPRPPAWIWAFTTQRWPPSSSATRAAAFDV